MDKNIEESKMAFKNLYVDWVKGNYPDVPVEKIETQADSFLALFDHFNKMVKDEFLKEVEKLDALFDKFMNRVL